MKFLFLEMYLKFFNFFLSEKLFIRTKAAKSTCLLSIFEQDIEAIRHSLEYQLFSKSVHFLFSLNELTNFLKLRQSFNTYKVFMNRIRTA